MYEKTNNGTKADDRGEPSNFEARRELWDQLRNALTMASSGDRIVWNIFGIFWAANAVLLAAFLRTGEFPIGLFGKVISSVGMLMSLVWWSIQSRALGHLGRYEDLYERIERELNLDEQFALSGKINTADWARNIPAGLRVRTLLISCCVLIFLAWTATLATLTIIEICKHL